MVARRQLPPSGGQGLTPAEANRYQAIFENIKALNADITRLDARITAVNIQAGVGSFNGRGGAVTLLGSDVTGALGYTPFNSQVSASPRVLGRGTAGAGGLEELTVGGGIEFNALQLRTAAFTGDVTKTAGGTALSIAANAVTDAKLRQAAARSVIGRSTTSIGDVADIAAADDTVLRATGTGALSFGTLVTNHIGASQVTYAKIQNVSATDKVLGRATAGAGVVEEIACTAFGRNMLALASITANRVPFGNGSSALQTSADFTWLSGILRTAGAAGINAFQVHAASGNDAGFTVQPGKTAGSVNLQGYNAALNAARDISLNVDGGNVGIGIAPAVALHVLGTPTTNSDARYNVIAQDPTAFAAGVGGGIVFLSKYNAGGTYFDAGAIKGIKENGTDGNFAGALVFVTHPNGGSPTERMRIDSVGNVGIGVTPSNNNTYPLLQFPQNGMVGSVGANFNIPAAAYYNSGWKYATSSVLPGLLGHDAGQLVYYTAPTGTAGNAISWVERLKIAPAGSVLSGDANASFQIKSSVANGGAGYSELLFGNASTPARAHISYNHSAEQYEIGTLGVTRLWLGSVALGVGAAVTAGHGKLQVAGYIKHQGFADVKAYGARGDGSSVGADMTAEAAAIQAACDSGYPVYFPPGTYRINTALTSSGKSLTLWGAGNDVSIIIVDGTAGSPNGLTFTGVKEEIKCDQLYIHDLAFYATGSVGTAVDARWTKSADPLGTNNAISNQPFIAERVIVGSTTGTGKFNKGFYIDKVGPTIRSCKFTQPWNSTPLASGTIGVHIFSTDDGAGGYVEGDQATDFLIDDCTFDKFHTGLKAETKIEGMHVRACTFIGVNGIDFDFTAHSGGLAPYFSIIDNHFNIYGAGVKIKGAVEFYIEGNTFWNLGYNASLATDLKFVHVIKTAYNYREEAFISRNWFHPGHVPTPPDPTYTTKYGIYIEGNSGTNKARNILIDGNKFSGGGLVGAAKYLTDDIYLNTNTTEILVTDTNRAEERAYGDTQVNNNGTGNIISGQRRSSAPTPTGGNGQPFTTASSSIDYTKDLNSALFHVTISIATNGAAAQDVRVTLPVTATLAANFVGQRVEGINGAGCVGYVAAGSSTLVITKADGTYPGASGAIIILTGRVFI